MRKKFDIIAITESWMDLDSKHFSTEFEIEGYNLFNFDRQGRRGGGVAVYMKDNIKCFSNQLIKAEGMAESVWVAIVKAKEKLHFGVIYRPPNAADGINTALFQEISKASRYGNACICGDFNYSGIDWTNLVGDSQAERFIEIIQDNFLK